MSKCKYCRRLENYWCGIVSDSPDPDLERYCVHFRHMTNADMMKAMRNEDLAELLADNWCDLVCGANFQCDRNCKQHVLDWLNMEVVEND